MTRSDSAPQGLSHADRERLLAQAIDREERAQSRHRETGGAYIDDDVFDRWLDAEVERLECEEGQEQAENAAVPRVRAAAQPAGASSADSLAPCLAWKPIFRMALFAIAVGGRERCHSALPARRASQPRLSHLASGPRSTGRCGCGRSCRPSWAPVRLPGHSVRANRGSALGRTARPQ